MLSRNIDVLKKGMANEAPLGALARKSWSGAHKFSQRGQVGEDNKWRARQLDLQEETDFQVYVVEMFPTHSRAQPV